MQQKYNKNNASTIFGVHQIPSTTQIANLLDPIEPSALYPLLAKIGDHVLASAKMAPYRCLENSLLITFDGTDTVSSEKICCGQCSQQQLANGNVLYRHIALTPVVVAPGQSAVIPLPPEFVQPQDGHKKQDCELNAAKRWLERWGRHYAARKVTLLGDDLYCHQPFCEAVRAQNMHFLFTCKPDSHALLYEWLEDFERTGQVNTLTVKRRQGNKRQIDHYRFFNHLPLRDSDDALHVNWCELVTCNEQGDVLYRNAWVTSHRLDAGNVVAVVAAARSRWKIENENNNVLKNHGYHFEHNFAHGKQNLANLLATLNLLAFLVHTALDMLDKAYHAVRKAAPSRRTFFEQIRALLHFIPFNNWDEFMLFMLDG